MAQRHFEYGHFEMARVNHFHRGEVWSSPTVRNTRRTRGPVMIGHSLGSQKRAIGPSLPVHLQAPQVRYDWTRNWQPGPPVPPKPKRRYDRFGQVRPRSGSHIQSHSQTPESFTRIGLRIAIPRPPRRPRRPRVVPRSAWLSVCPPAPGGARTGTPPEAPKQCTASGGPMDPGFRKTL